MVQTGQLKSCTEGKRFEGDEQSPPTIQSKRQKPGHHAKQNSVADVMSRESSVFKSVNNHRHITFTERILNEDDGSLVI